MLIPLRAVASSLFALLLFVGVLAAELEATEKACVTKTITTDGTITTTKSGDCAKKTKCVTKTITTGGITTTTTSGHCARKTACETKTITTSGKTLTKTSGDCPKTHHASSTKHKHKTHKSACKTKTITTAGKTVTKTSGDCANTDSSSRSQKHKSTHKSCETKTEVTAGKTITKTAGDCVHTDTTTHSHKHKSTHKACETKTETTSGKTITKTAGDCVRTDATTHSHKHKSTHKACETKTETTSGKTITKTVGNCAKTTHSASTKHEHTSSHKPCHTKTETKSGKTVTKTVGDCAKATDATTTKHKHHSTHKACETKTLTTSGKTVTKTSGDCVKTHKPSNSHDHKSTKSSCETKTITTAGKTTTTLVGDCHASCVAKTITSGGKTITTTAGCSSTKSRVVVAPSHKHTKSETKSDKHNPTATKTKSQQSHKTTHNPFASITNTITFPWKDIKVSKTSGITKATHDSKHHPILPPGCWFCPPGGGGVGWLLGEITGPGILPPPGKGSLPSGFSIDMPAITVDKIGFPTFSAKSEPKKTHQSEETKTTSERCKTTTVTDKTYFLDIETRSGKRVTSTVSTDIYHTHGCSIKPTTVYRTVSQSMHSAVPVETGIIDNMAAVETPVPAFAAGISKFEHVIATLTKAKTLKTVTTKKPGHTSTKHAHKTTSKHESTSVHASKTSKAPASASSTATSVPAVQLTCTGSSSNYPSFTLDNANDAISKFCVTGRSFGDIGQTYDYTGGNIALTLNWNSDQNGCHISNNQPETIDVSDCKKYFGEAVNSCNTGTTTNKYGANPLIWDSQWGCLAFSITGSRAS